MADGQLSGAELAEAIDWVGDTEDGRRYWQAYHVLGEVLRGDQVGALAEEEAFLERLRERLKREPTPARSVEAANDTRFHWAKLMGVMLLLVGSLLGWQAWVDSDEAAGKARLVQGPAETPATMIRDPQLDALLAAHKQFGGASALQMPAGFLRNATFQEGAP